MAYLEKEDDFYGDQEEDMLKHEIMFMENKFHNIGFQESLEESKDIRLEQGFMDGFDDLIENSLNIGKIVGDYSMKSVLNDDINNNNLADLEKLVIKIKEDIVSFLNTQNLEDMDAKTHFCNIERYTNSDKELK